MPDGQGALFTEGWIDERKVRLAVVPNHWWDTYIRPNAIAKGEPDPGPLYRVLPDKGGRP